MSAVLTNFPIPDAWSQSVAAKLRELGEQGVKTFGSRTARAKRDTLTELAAHTLSLAPDNQSLGALYEAQANGGWGNREKFTPGPKASRFLAACGGLEGSPPPAELLAELVQHTQADVIAAVHARAKVNGQKARRDALKEAQAKIEAEVSRAQESEQTAIARAAKVEARVAELEREVKYLRDLIEATDTPSPEPAPEPEEPKAEAPEPDEYKGVEGFRGVHRRPSNGSIKVGYQDDGETKWLTLGPGVKLELAAEIRDQLGKGKITRDEARLLAKAPKAVA